jgi:hypothetical protein
MIEDNVSIVYSNLLAVTQESFYLIFKTNYMSQALTKEEFLKSTIDYYSADPANRRCTSAVDRCYYSPEHANKPTSEGCAIGRHLTSEEGKKMWDDANLTIDELATDPDYKGYMPEWMQALPRRFLAGVQSLHDNRHNWDATGLTDRGKRSVNSIIRLYKLNLPQL